MERLDKFSFLGIHLSEVFFEYSLTQEKEKWGFSYTRLLFELSKGTHTALTRFRFLSPRGYAFFWLVAGLLSGRSKATNPIDTLLVGFFSYERAKKLEYAFSNVPKESVIGLTLNRARPPLSLKHLNLFSYLNLSDAVRIFRLAKEITKYLRRNQKALAFEAANERTSFFWLVVFFTHALTAKRCIEEFKIKKLVIVSPEEPMGRLFTGLAKEKTLKIRSLFSKENQESPFLSPSTRNALNLVKERRTFAPKNLKRQVLFAMQAIPQDLSILKELKAICGELRHVSVVIRPHPVQIRWVTRLIYKEEKFCETRSAIEALRDVDLLVTHSSSLATYAAFIGIPSILYFSKPSVFNMSQLYFDENLTWAKNFHELREAICQRV